MKIIAIESGGDWVDASVDYWVELKPFDPEVERKEFRGSYRYRSLGEHLAAKGLVRPATQEDGLVVIDDG